MNPATHQEPSPHLGQPKTHGLVGAATMVSAVLVLAIGIFLLYRLSIALGMWFVDPIDKALPAALAGGFIAAAAKGLAMGVVIWCAGMLIFGFILACIALGSVLFSPSDRASKAPTSSGN